MADIRGDVVGGVLPRVNGDPNIVRDSCGEPAEANGNIYNDDDSADAGEAFVLPAAPLGSTATGRH